MTHALLAGRYELQERLGRGAVGQVWAAHDTRLQRMVAIKTVDLSSKDDPAVEQRFQREAITTAGLSSANVVRVYDAGTEGETAYLVMELLDGRSIADLIREHGPLPLSEALRLGAQVADGLASAHEAGVTHRDIKPANVMLHDDEAKIVDFGIARLAAAQNETLTSAAMVIGTASYMSPEQGLGEPVTAASDVYSLGCLLYAMLTGRPPFRAETAVALMRAHCDDVPPRLSNQLPGISPALDELVACCLAKAPHRRPTAQHVAAELRRIASDPMSPSQLPESADATVLRPASGPTPPAVAGPPVTPAAFTAQPSPATGNPSPLALHATPSEPQAPATATSSIASLDQPAAAASWARPQDSSPHVPAPPTTTVPAAADLDPTLKDVHVIEDRRSRRALRAGVATGVVVAVLAATAVALFWWPGVLRRPAVVVVTPPPVTVTDPGHRGQTNPPTPRPTPTSDVAKQREAVTKAISQVKDETARTELKRTWAGLPAQLTADEDLDPIRGQVAAFFSLNWISQQEYDSLTKALDRLAEQL